MCAGSGHVCCAACKGLPVRANARDPQGGDTGHQGCSPAWRANAAGGATDRDRAESSLPPAPWLSHVVAKWWARFLGALPMLLLTWLCGLAAQAVYVRRVRCEHPSRRRGRARCCYLRRGECGARPHFFIMRSVAASTEGRRRQSDYFEALHARARAASSGREYKLLFFVPRAPVARDTDRASSACSRALVEPRVGRRTARARRNRARAGVVERRHRPHQRAGAAPGTPWVFIGAVTVGVLGAFGFTENHRVPTIDLSHAGLSLVGMSIAAAAIGLVLMLCWAAAVVWTRPGRRWKFLARLGWVCAAFIGVGAVLWVASGREQNAPQPTAGDAGGKPAKSKELELALIDWLEQLCALEADCPKRRCLGESGGRGQARARVHRRCRGRRHSRRLLGGARAHPAVHRPARLRPAHVLGLGRVGRRDRRSRVARLLEQACEGFDARTRPALLVCRATRAG